MDTEFDFLTPEFLHLLFFQQKSLVIFPYVDLKHLHSLDVFTLGYEAVDIDSTALHNLGDVLNYELNSSYSQSSPFYFILNANSEHIEQLLDISNIHCIVNTSENVSALANGNSFVFFNKKSKLFLNYDFNTVDLSFETELLQRSHNTHELIDEIFKIKNGASKIFSSINVTSSSEDLPKLLADFDSAHWDKILGYTKLFYGIEIPAIPKSQVIPKKRTKPPLTDFSHEYSMILKSNRKIGQEFIQALHEYRYQKVNPANLDNDQLFYPAQLYTYLRNHHWKAGIPQEFTDEWVLMKNTGNSLTEVDLLEFQDLFRKLNMEVTIQDKVPEGDSQESHPLKKDEPISNHKKIERKVSQITTTNTISIPSIENFEVFKKWLVSKVDKLEKLVQEKVK